MASNPQKDMIMLVMKRLTGLIEESKAIQGQNAANVEGVVKLFLHNMVDGEYNVPDTKDFNFTLTVVENMINLSIMGIKKLSMRKLLTLDNMGAVQDIVVDSKSSNNIDCLRITIKMYMEDAELQQKHVWAHENTLIIDPKLNGLQVNPESRADSQFLIQALMNMNKEGFEPTILNSLNQHGDKYMISCSPVKSISLSFYKSLVNHIPESLLNVVATIEKLNSYREDMLLETNVCVKLEIYCKCRESDKSRAVKTDVHHDMGVKLPITKTKKVSKGLFGSFKLW